MANKYNLSGLLAGPKFSTPCDVQLQVEVCDYENLDKVNPDFKNGVKITGELSYIDSTPPSFAFATGMTPTLTLKPPIDTSLGETKLSIVLFNSPASTDIGKQRRYFWQFSPLDVITDYLGIIPEEFSFIHSEQAKNKVFICQDFRGSWPYPVSAVVSAPNKFEAKRILASELKHQKIPCVESQGFTLLEVDCISNFCYIIQDGE